MEGKSMRKSFLVIAVLVALLLVSVVARATSNVPGTEDDPVVSKSYLDARITFTAVELTGGQKLIGNGGTEMILRSGEASAIDNGANGISDLTAGIDLMTGEQVGLNHLIMVPRTDGRGITALTDAWVMVRGEYEILR